MCKTGTSWADKSNINILHGFVAAVGFRAIYIYRDMRILKYFSNPCCFHQGGSDGVSVGESSTGLPHM